MPKFTHQGQSLNFELQGKGNPLIFLHGFLEDLSMWDNIYPAFVKDDYQCVCIDLPCHGSSWFMGDNCSMSMMANLVNALLVKLEITGEIIVGHSMGGYVALELNALRSSEIILLHSNFWEDSEDKKANRNRVIDIVQKNKSLLITEAIPALFAEKNKKSCNSAIEKLIARAKKIPTSEIVAATAGMRDRKSFSSQIASMTISLIQGEFDPIISPRDMNQALTNIDFRPTLIEIKNVGHMSIWEDPKSLIKTLKTLIIR